MVTQPPSGLPLTTRNLALRNFDDFAGRVTELEQLCATSMQMNQKLLALLATEVRGFTTNSTADPIARQRQLEAMQQRFNLQYMYMQQNMQDESRRFSLLSNIMKTKHDTARSSINNLR